MSENIEEKQERKKYGKRFWILLGIVKVSIIVIALLLFFVSKNSGTSSFNFKHIHGLGFASNGSVMMPSSGGMATYNHGKWSVPNSDKNNYTGFAAVNDGFYGSGHPGNGADLPDPLGVIKATENGKKISKQSLGSVSNFKFMAAGYYSQVLYVINPAPNDLMKQQGLYYSLDKGKTWTYSQAKGLKGNVTAIAAEPNKKNVVAIGTDKGVFYSDNYGKQFKPFFKGKKVTALSYSFDHELLVATYDGKSSLDRLSPTDGASLGVEISSVETEPIIYIAQNPKDTQELVIAAKNLDLFTTSNFGHNWVFIAKNGKGLSGQ